MRLNITHKLIFVVIILVVLPVLATGLTANRAAKKIVTQLLNESQIALAREIAEQANQLFKTALADIKTVSALPALSDYYYNMFYNLNSEADISRGQIQGFFSDMANKSEFYYGISYLNADGVEIVNITQNPKKNTNISLKDNQRPIVESETRKDGIWISAVITIEDGQHQVIRFSRVLYDVWNQACGIVRLDLDFDKFSDRLLSRKVGLNGFTFLMDTKGRIVVHPAPFPRDSLQRDMGNTSFDDMVIKMLKDRQGMTSYDENGVKVAAFTPIEENGWIVAVALPESEFSERVNIIGKHMLLIVFLAASITIGVGILFSWQFVKPIKQLAQATNIISAGGLPSQLESTSKDELGILTRSFNHMVRNLRRVQAELVQSEKLVSLGRLATGVAHEIRNPLNDMKVAAEVLANKEPTTQEAKNLAKLIADEVAHLNSFVTEFLSYARQPSLKKIGTDVNQLVTDVLESAKQKMKLNNIELVMCLYNAIPVVPVDPFQMERVLLNVITNAVDAMPYGGTLRVSTALKKKDKKNFTPFLMIEIADSGHGLPAEQLKLVFDPFFTTKEHGTGLGLSLTKSIIEAHDGSISVANNPGPGLCVAIFLPLETLKSDDQ